MRLNFFLLVVTLVICCSSFAAAAQIEANPSGQVNGEERRLSWFETFKKYITTNEEKLKKLAKAGKNIFP
ncbi:hypothetical protein DVH05_008408 [Phytophthora capsici]|nr:hypothetical protein DVH05_008408 [Phytophthora capsici]